MSSRLGGRSGVDNQVPVAQRAPVDVEDSWLADPTVAANQNCAGALQSLGVEGVVAVVDDGVAPLACQPVGLWRGDPAGEQH